MRLKKAHQKDGYYRVVIDRCTGCGAKLTDYDLERGLFETSSGLLCLSCVENTQRKSHEKKTNKSVLIEASASIWHKTKVVLKKQISKRVVLVLPSAVFAVGLLLILTVSYLQGETKHGEKKMVVRQREPLPTVNSKEKAAEDVIVRLLEKRETEKKETVKEEGRSESSGSEEKEEKKEKPSGGFVIPTTDERVDAEFGSRDKFQEEKSQREEKSPDRQTNDKTNRGGAEKSRRAEAARETMERVPRPVAKENLKPAESQAKKESFQEEVDKAIGKGVKWLLSQQNFDGSFQGFYNRRNPMGNTAIALYALLSAGVRPDSEEIRKGFEYLSGLPLDKTYDVSLLLLAIDSYFTKPLQKRLPNKWRTEVENEFKRGPASLRGLAEKAAKWLVEAQLENGMWTYTRQPSTGWAAGGDMSNAQFALLGLDAACRLGISIPAKTFIKSIEVLLFQVQQEKGEEYKNPFYVPAAEESLSGIRKREEERKSGKGRTEVVQDRGEKMFVRGFGYT
ncbi:MAG: terpene cyclase/mutase family protein, partial [Planctomycetota bacterium]|nr:terpene cyclase/mutase family protein [Planctomycetota bacterium]